MSCILTATGRVGEIVREEDRVLFSVCSQGHGKSESSKRKAQEWTTFVVTGRMDDRLNRLIRPNDFVFVQAAKITETQKDENGNAVPVTYFRVLSAAEALMRVNRPWTKKPARLRKDIDTPDAFKIEGIDIEKKDE